MNYMDDVNRWKAIYRLLNMVNTEPYDCGELCGSACCECQNKIKESSVCDHQPLDEDQELDMNDLGIYLFPGEHLLLSDPSVDTGWLEWSTQDPEELGFPESWTEPVYFVKCKTPPVCPRKFRPLQCRTFPLKPVFGENGVLELIWNDEELPYVCPIIEENRPIHDDFYKATYTAWTHLLRDRRIFDLILMWSE